MAIAAHLLHVICVIGLVGWLQYVRSLSLLHRNHSAALQVAADIVKEVLLYITFLLRQLDCSATQTKLPKYRLLLAQVHPAVHKVS